MKMMSLDRRCLRRIGGAVAAIFALCLCTASPQDAGPDQLREEALKLNRKAEGLKADGRQDEAREVMQEAEKLRAKANRMTGPVRPDAQERQELQKRTADLEARLKELRTAGNQDEAMEVERELQKIRREMPRRGPGPGFGGPGPMGRERPGLETDMRPRQRAEAEQPPRGDLEQRLRHLQVAIENLHAAGLHEPAERLTQRAQRMRRQIGQGPAPLEGRPPVMDQMEELRREVRELREAIGGLKQRVEELSRERRP